MSTDPLATAHHLLTQVFGALKVAAGSGSDDDLVSVLTFCQHAVRGFDRASVDTLAAVERRGIFTQRGYSSAPDALADLLGAERPDARRRVLAAEHVATRVALDGTPLPPRLPATADAFAAGHAGLRHVEVIAQVLGTKAAARLTMRASTPQRAARVGHRPGGGTRPGRRRTRRPAPAVGQRAVHDP